MINNYILYLFLAFWFGMLIASIIWALELKKYFDKRDSKQIQEINNLIRRYESKIETEKSYNHFSNEFAVGICSKSVGGSGSFPPNQQGGGGVPLSEKFIIKES